jgi:hypothetical protein
MEARAFDAEEGQDKPRPGTKTYQFCKTQLYQSVLGSKCLRIIQESI